MHASVMSAMRYLCLCVFFWGGVSCKTYYQKTRLVHEYFEENRLREAEKVVRNTSFYFKLRNQFLFHVELGALQFFLQDFVGAAQHFNAADYFEEDYNTRANRVNDAAKEILLNSMQSTYKGEYFERFMLHYYKIIAYLAQNRDEDARVEARRLNLRLRQFHDISRERGKKYAVDAFAHMLQGMVYERLKEYNDAFISYQAAYDIYSKDSVMSGQHAYSVQDRLRQDILRMARLSGLTDKYQQYQSQWNVPENVVSAQQPYEAIIFWENGLVPVKTTKNYWFAVVPINGVQMLYCSALDLVFPLPEGLLDNHNIKLKDLGLLRITFPRLVDRDPIIQSAQLLLTDTIGKGQYRYTQIPIDEIIDIADLAKRSLADRRKHDLPIALGRAVFNKVTELSIKMARKASASQNNQNPLGDQVNDLVSSLWGIASLVKETADTRSWLTLPSTIHYTRIPLKKGNNEIKMSFIGANRKKQHYTFSIQCDQEGLYFRSLRTPFARPPDPLRPQ